MNDAHHFLQALAIVLCVAGATTVLFRRLHQPVVLGYALAGVIVGPHVPIPLVADPDVVHTLSELGVILLMFSLGLEFRLDKLARLATTAGITAVVESSIMVWLGFVAGRLFGWTTLESLYTGAVVAISSTTIIAKAFAEHGIKGKLAEIVFGLLICEDLVGILLLAILTAVGSGAQVSLSSLARTTGQLAGFIVGLLVAGMLVIPRLMRLVVRQARNETIVVATVGLSFGFALLARAFGYSVALGAFFGGALVAESGEGKLIERLIEPVRDVFAAVFFVSVGMLIDPALIARHWVVVLALTAVVVAGKLIGVGVGCFLVGFGVRTSVQAGMSLGQIGEFSFIIAGLGLSVGATRSFTYPVTVAVSALTTLLTPWLIRGSDSVAAYVDRRLPHAIQTYAALYGSWVEGLRSTHSHATAWSRIRRLIVRLCLDLAIVAALAIGASLSEARVLELARRFAGMSPILAQVLFFALTIVFLSPFLLGAVRLSRALGLALAVEALPSSDSGLDLADAPRKALLVSLQIAILLIAGGPLVTVIQPFYPRLPGLGLLLFLVLALIYPLWRSAGSVHGHVRAGAQLIVEALTSIGRDSSSASMDEQVHALLPGLGDASAFRLETGSAAVGHSLKQIALRGRSGATVIAIQRDPSETIFPSADEILRGGDILILTGSKDSVRAAKQILG